MITKNGNIKDAGCVVSTVDKSVDLLVFYLAMKEEVEMDMDLMMKYSIIFWLVREQ